MKLISVSQKIIVVRIIPQELPKFNYDKFYLNLTNGLEVLNYIKKSPFQLNNINFIRIQSSHCERNRLDLVLRDIDYDFIVNFVSGKRILIADGYSRQYPPRSFFIGIEFIRYCICKITNQEFFPAFTRTKNSIPNFNNKYLEIKKQYPSLFKKLKYIKRIFNTVTPNKWYLTYIIFKSELDGKYEKLFRSLK